MNSTLKRLLTVIFLITVVSQACQYTSTGAIPVMDLAGSKSKIEPAWSDLAKDCRLIPLELYTNVVLPGKFNYWIGDKYYLDQLSVEVKELYNQLNEDSNPVLVVGSAF